MKRILILCAALFAVSQLLFLINIQVPRGHNYYEFHYVPSAKQFLEFKENQNWEHPPLGKVIMAAGIAAWGDIPIGWRYMSTLFGSLTLVGMFVWALALFGSESIALWVALITVVNQLLYVQARIGMLDTFMFGFITWGLTAFTASWNPQNTVARNRLYLAATGFFMGMGIACKWFGVIPLATCVGGVVLVKLFQEWKTRFEPQFETDWYHPGIWNGISLGDWVFFLGVVPFLTYAVTFAPLYIIQKPPIGFWDFFEIQKKMYDGQLRVTSQHPYMSQWPDWPLLKRPIWYAFDKEGPETDEWVRGVLLLGNPLIMWAGMLAIFACVWGWVKQKSRVAFLILLFYAAFYVSWAVIPRKVAFYYYYYPAGMVLSFALAYAFQLLETRALPRHPGAKWGRWLFLAASLGIFVYFFPILAALRIPSADFIKWMWFRSWI